MADRRTRQLSIAIIGAGMAGLTCANTLNRSGFHVSVFEKSRGLGGRLATRRAGDFTFDHGAQYITARSPEFRTRVLPETESANCAIWNPDVRPQLAPKEDWFVGVPGMSALVKWFEDGISVTKGTKIVDLSRSRFGWKIASEDGWIPQSFDFLVLAIPAPQASELINRTGIEIPQLNDVSIAPCWTLMAAFDRPFDLKHDALRLDKGPIAWMARNQSKTRFQGSCRLVRFDRIGSQRP